MNTLKHIPVLLKETIDGVNIHTGDTVVDATLGSGGHALAMLRSVLPNGTVIAMDTDASALQRFLNRIESELWAKQALQEERIKLFHNNFSEIGQVLDRAEVTTVAAIIADLGFSSDQMDNPDRGLSFMQSGPLDMRLDQESTLMAERVINEYDERQLADIFDRYGDERSARGIAKAIVKRRMKQPFQTTLDVAEMIASLPSSRGAKNIHPATKVFQALRMEVNQERMHLVAFLPQAIERLAPLGRLGVIAFHSGEDRLVKEVFRENARGCICPKNFPVCRCHHQAQVRILTARPIQPEQREVNENPRSRSAKLRIVEKVCE